MGLTAANWLTIAIFVASMVGAILAWLLRRFISTIDKHEQAIYGDEGLLRQLERYVKREDHDVANAELVAHMEKMRLEGMQRESRIVDAIDRAGEIARQDQGQLRSSMEKLNERIDRLRDSNPRRQ